MLARMSSLTRILDSLTTKALTLLTTPKGGGFDRLQEEMTSLRVQGRQLVKTLRKNLAEMRRGA